jgi:hypothetical protein
MTVTLRRDDGGEQSFRIVGEDEADPSRGTLSHLSPLARALHTCMALERRSQSLGTTHHPGRAVRERAALPKSPALRLGRSAGMGIER